MMTRLTKWLGLALLALAPTVAAAQPVSPPIEGGAGGGKGELTAPPPQRVTSFSTLGILQPTAMYEDIEIMRRILSRDLQAHQQASCAACHSSPVRVAFSPDGNRLTYAYTKAPGRPGGMMAGTGGGAAVLEMTGLSVDVDGTYLKDYGVVLQVNMPPSLGVKRDPAKPATKAVSEWERARKELHGEILDKPASPSQSSGPNLTDFLIKLLADNGRNFSKLGAKENVTIVVTFRLTNDPHGLIGYGALFGLSGGTGDMMGSYGFSGSELKGRSLNPPVNPALGATDAAVIGLHDSIPGGRGVQGGGGGAAGVGDFELLGDLQIKQGRVQDAVQAYEKAVAAQPDRKRKASLYQKMAHAIIKLDETSVDNKNKSIAKAIEYLKHAQENVNTPAGVPESTKAPALLTSKLIVSASKEWLDAAAVRALSFDAFRQGVRVERIAIPAPEKTRETKRSPGP